MNILEILGQGVETTTVANTKGGSIADKVIVLGEVKLSAKNTNKIEGIEYDFAYTSKNKKGLFSISNAFKDQHPELEDAKTGFNQLYKAGENILYVNICSDGEEIEPLFYNRKRGEFKGNTFTAASLSYYAERAGLLNEEEDGTTYFKLTPHTIKSVDAEGKEQEVVVPRLFVMSVASIKLVASAKPEKEVVAPVENVVVETIAETPVVIEQNPVASFSASINNFESAAPIESVVTAVTGEGVFVAQVNELVAIEEEVVEVQVVTEQPVSESDAMIAQLENDLGI